jgi:hypothetical protein
MRNRASFILAALLAALLAGCFKPSPAPVARPQTVSFSGYTNGVVGFVASTMVTWKNQGPAIQQWLTAGTNAAVFAITNCQTCPVVVYPFVQIRDAGGCLVGHQTLLLNAPNFSGIQLKPGQVGLLQIALLPHDAPWRALFFYHRDQPIGVGESLQALILRRPIRTKMEMIDGGTITN